MVSRWWASSAPGWRRNAHLGVSAIDRVLIWQYAASMALEGAHLVLAEAGGRRCRADAVEGSPQRGLRPACLVAGDHIAAETLTAPLYRGLRGGAHELPAGQVDSGPDTQRPQLFVKRPKLAEPATNSPFQAAEAEARHINLPTWRSTTAASATRGPWHAP